MDTSRRKQLMEEYKNRKPEMGVISFRCIASGEAFFGASKDTRVGFNSNRTKLNANGHPNKCLQELWNKYGEDGFEITLLREYKYEDVTVDHSTKLEKLLEQCLESEGTAKRIWK